jgi:hypothetical protein
VMMQASLALQVLSSTDQKKYEDDNR